MKRCIEAWYNPILMSADSEVTRLLQRWSDGDPRALEHLLPRILADIRRLARSFMAREGSDHTLQATALINEVYLRLEKRRTVNWESSAQFFAFLGNLMRRILIDHARHRQAGKRGGGERPLPFDETLRLPDHRDPDLLALDDALRSLAKIDRRQSQIVELRYFVGLTHSEIAEALGISVSTVKRDWGTARLFLLQELKGD